MKNVIRLLLSTVVAMTFILAFAGKSFAQDAAKNDAPVEITLTLKNHVFVPSTIEAPENRKIKLTLVNEDNAVEEFESMSLRREKMVPAKGTIVLTFGPLAAGTYEFIGEFHKDTAKGELIVK